jgi:hypothetical protein
MGAALRTEFGPKGGGDVTRKSLFVLPLLLGLTAAAAGQSPADNPLAPRSRLPNSALPDLERQIPGTLPHPHAYDITPDAGAYCVCVMSYSGPMAGPLAEELVTVLRRDYKLPGYFFDRSEEARLQEKERLDQNRKQRETWYMQNGIPLPDKVVVKRTLHIEAQYAVLVTDKTFKDIDTARRALDRIRTLPPPKNTRLMNQGTVAGVDGQGDWAGTARQAYLNPFLTAFVVPNPTVPRQAPPPSDEPVVNLRRLNSAEDYSLFKCPGKWTLVVKSYQGGATFVSKESEKSVLERLGLGGNNQGSLLDAAGRQAHQLAEILRNPQLGFDAYVLHTKDLSIVTVGSFESEKDQRMQQMMGHLAKLRLEPYEQLQPPTPFRVPK